MRITHKRWKNVSTNYYFSYQLPLIKINSEERALQATTEKEKHSTKLAQIKGNIFYRLFFSEYKIKA